MKLIGKDLNRCLKPINLNVYKMGDSSSRFKTTSTQTPKFRLQLDRGLDFCVIKDSEGIDAKLYVYDKRMLNLPVVDETAEN